MRPFRTPDLPHDVAAHIEGRDRVLATAPLAAGVHAVARTATIAVVGADGVRWQRPWHDVDHGSWDEAVSAITILWVDGSETVLDFHGEPPRAFLEAFRERVQSSVVHVERLELRGGVTVRAVIRRAAGGSLFSQVIAHGAVGSLEEDAKAILALEARARRAVGLPG
jgi:hypothetical protein